MLNLGRAFFIFSEESRKRFGIGKDEKRFWMTVRQAALIHMATEEARVWGCSSWWPKSVQGCGSECPLAWRWPSTWALCSPFLDMSEDLINSIMQIIRRDWQSGDGRLDVKFEEGPWCESGPAETWVWISSTNMDILPLRRARAKQRCQTQPLPLAKCECEGKQFPDQKPWKISASSNYC